MKSETESTGNAVHAPQSGKKRTVLLVHNYYQQSGGEDTVVSNEKKLLEEHGHRVILYTRDNAEIREYGFLHKAALPFCTLFNPRTYREVRRIIRAEGVDIVHVHNTLPLVSPAVYYAARSMGVPAVQTVHNFRLLCPNALFFRDGHVCEDCLSHGLLPAVRHRCYRDSAAQTLLCVLNTRLHRAAGIYGKLTYICLTAFNRDKLLSLRQIPRSRVFVKPNFVWNTDTVFIPAGEREDQYCIAGRLDPFKGVDKALEAWKELEARKRPGETVPRLIVCGTGPMEAQYREYAEKHILNVEFRGFVSHAEVLDVLSHSRALIFPTLWYEGFGMGIPEAFSVGTPVICSDIGNPGSLVREGVTGRKFPAGDAKALAAVLSDDTAARSGGTETAQSGGTAALSELGAAALREFREKYGPEANYRKLMEIYDRAEALDRRK